MKKLLALSLAFAVTFGAIAPAQGAAGAPGEGRLLFQYGE
ncbi:hypothetical protein CTP10_R73370 (plasmid) [Cupriavidus sp. P-10]|nr:hypothetical protein CTP10_R73370 [Cupriavidus sp. P-10]